ncbi:MAG: hypothetical protein ACOC22_03930, partial [bacterium]
EKHKNLQYAKERLNYFSSKNLKIGGKYIALNPTGVASPAKSFSRVQHGLIAGRCAPHRVLFIACWLFLLIINCLAWL